MIIGSYVKLNALSILFTSIPSYTICNNDTSQVENLTKILLRSHKIRSWQEQFLIEIIQEVSKNLQDLAKILNNHLAKIFP